jgi:hypothetical protein
VFVGTLSLFVREGVETPYMMLRAPLSVPEPRAKQASQNAKPNSSAATPLLVHLANSLSFSYDFNDTGAHGCQHYSVQPFTDFP